MILTDRIASAVAACKVDVAFRCWATERVRPGDTFRSSAGIIAVTAIEVVAEHTLTDCDARRAGLASLEALRTTFRGDESDPIYRIGLIWVGPDPRDALADDDALTTDDIIAIAALLDRLDARIPWARTTLQRIGQQPGVRAAELADDLPIDKESLKRRIRQLKEHGLTRSLPTGYELSPRGHAYQRATSRDHGRHPS